MNWDKRAFILTSVIFVLLIISSLFFGFITPLPLPGEEGIEINFGEDETGLGAEEPRVNEEVVKAPEPSEPEVSKPQDVEEAQLTQDYEEAPAVAAKEEKVKQKEEVKEKVKEEPKEEPKPQVNSNALYRGRKENSESTSSQGDAGGSGNQGSTSGSVDATSQSLGGGGGNGISFSLAGRSPVALPVPTFNTQKEGRVVVRVRVDRKGKVVFAEPGVKGSTTLDKDLLAAAKRAALASSFNNKSDAPAMQEGTITYVFRLRGN